MSLNVSLLPQCPLIIFTCGKVQPLHPQMGIHQVFNVWYAIYKLRLHCILRSPPFCHRVTNLEAYFTLLLPFYYCLVYFCYAVFLTKVL